MKISGGKIVFENLIDSATDLPVELECRHSEQELHAVEHLGKQTAASIKQLLTEIDE